MLSIIIPARNEVSNLETILDYFNKGMKNINFEVILIDDFSDDDTLIKSKTLFEPYKNFKVYLIFYCHIILTYVSEWNVI